MIQSDWYYTLCAGGRIASSFLRCWSIAGHCGRRTRPWPTLLTTPASFTTGSPQAPRIICSITWKHNLQMSIIIKYIIGSLVSLFLKKTVLVNKLVLQKNKFWRILIFFKKRCYIVWVSVTNPYLHFHCKVTPCNRLHRIYLLDRMMLCSFFLSRISLLFLSYPSPLEFHKSENKTL